MIPLHRWLPLGLLVLLLSGAAHALTPAEVLFHAPLDGSVTPAIKQSAEPPVVTGAPQFAAGKRGQGLLVGGQPALSLRYPAPGNWLPAQGTIALWVCPQDWHSGDGKHHVFLALEGNPMALLYCYIGLPTFFLQLTPDNRNPHVGSELGWKEGEWRHLVVTWQEGEFSLYADGKLISRDTETMTLPRDVGTHFGVGTHAWGTQDRTLLDELVILRRSLVAEEVKALYDWYATSPAPAAGPVPTVTDVPPFRASLRHFPSAGKLQVSVRATGSGLEPGTMLPVDLEVQAASGKPLLKQSLTAPVGQATVHEVVVGGWKAGTYKALLTTSDAAGQKRTVELAFERRGKAEWEGNRLGLEDEIPPPWPAVFEVLAGARDVQVTLWGRRYVFDGLSVPTVETQGASLLAGAMGLRRTVGKGLATAQPEWLKLAGRNRQSAIILASGRLGDCTLKARTTVEFDGFTWIEYELVPPPGGATVERLSWDTPYAPSRATLLYSGVYYPALDNGTGALKPEGFQGSWRNWFWVGEERGGLQWFAEDDRGWVLSKPQEALTVTPGVETTLTRLNIIDQPTKLTRPLKFSFGFQATPVKPQRPDRRRWRVIGQQPATEGEKPYMLPEDRRVKGVTLWNEGWTSTWMIPKPHDWARESIAKQEQSGTRPCMYLAQNTVDPREEQFQFYWEDWRKTPGVAFSREWLEDKSYYLETGVCPASGYRDYFIWLLDKAIRETGLRGLYFDNSLPALCDNPHHGCGQAQPDGTVRGRVPLRAAREWYKRAYMLLKKHDPTAFVAIHMSGWPAVPLQAFSDIIIDGENFTGYMQVMKNEKGWQDYTQMLPLDVVRAQYRNHWGPDTAFLPEFGRAWGQEWNSSANPRVTAGIEHLMGLFFVHDSGIWPGWSTVEPYGRLYRAQDRFGWDEQVSFVPYWDLRGLADLRGGSDQAVMSLYRRPGSVMLVPLNNTGQAVTATVTWDPAKLGLGEGTCTALEDYLRGERFPVTNNAAQVPLPAHNFRMLVPVR